MQAITLEPTDAESWAYLGRCRSARLEHAEAISANERALELSPQEPEAICQNLAAAQRRLEMQREQDAAALAGLDAGQLMDQQISRLDEVIGLQPAEDTEALLQRGKLLVRRGGAGDDATAEGDFKTAQSSAAPTDYRPSLNLGHVASGRGEWREAAQLYNSAVSRAPSESQPLAARGLVRMSSLAPHCASLEARLAVHSTYLARALSLSFLYTALCTVCTAVSQCTYATYLPPI